MTVAIKQADINTACFSLVTVQMDSNLSFSDTFYSIK